MVSVVVDSSVLIDHFRQKSRDFIKLTKLQDKGEIKILIPLIVAVELFAGRSTRNKKVEKMIDKILSKVKLVGLTRKSAKIAGKLIRDCPQLSGPYDVLIAAIALEQKARVATGNVRHFKQIKGLRLYRA